MKGPSERKLGQLVLARKKALRARKIKQEISLSKKLQQLQAKVPPFFGYDD